MDSVQPCDSVVFTEIRTIASNRGAKIITKEEWANLKPRIEDLYLRDNQTFPKVQKALEQEFGVSITPRQFKRKIEDWGFKKNFRKHEKEQIIKGGPLDGSLAHDRRANRVRIDRLRRRNGIAATLPCEKPAINDIEMEESDIVPSRESDNNMASLVPYQIFTPEAHMAQEPPEDCDITIEEAPQDCDMTTEELPHSEGPRNVLNRHSHGLPPDARYMNLFAELDIEIALASTKLKNSEEGIGEEQFISKSEFHNIYRSDDHISTCMEICSAEASDRSQPNPSEISSVRCTYHTAKSRDTWSPLFEIDVFPLGRISDRGTRKSSGPFWKSLIVEYEERKGQLSKLRQTLPEFSPGIISNLERLTSIAFHQEIFSLYVFEQLLKARLNEKTPSTYKIVEASLRLIEYCVERTLFNYVAQFHEDLHGRIRKNWPEDNPLHLRSSYSMAYILYSQSKIDEAEAMIRPVIRIALSNLGPYNDFTLKVLRLLGHIIQNSELLEEADRLLKLNIDILEQRALDKAWWVSSDNLLKLLVKRGHYSESISLSRHIIACVEANLGREHSVVCRSRAELARVLRKQGKMSEAITFLREALHTFEGVADTEYLLYYELAICYQYKDDFLGAVVFCQKVLKRYVVSFEREWTDNNVIQICENISYCYEKLGKYKDAALFYNRVLEKLYFYKETSLTRKYIERFQYWLDGALEMLEREEGAENEKKRVTNSKAVKGSIAEEHKTDEKDTEVIDPDGGWEENVNRGWDEIFDLGVWETEFTVENLGLDEEFSKLDISQSC